MSSEESNSPLLDRLDEIAELCRMEEVDDEWLIPIPAKYISEIYKDRAAYLSPKQQFKKFVEGL